MTLYELIAIIIAVLSLGVAIGSFTISKKANLLQENAAEKKKLNIEFLK
ncbi:MAG: hypothetical protein MJZ75_06160 [Paludibacteraceae bacterium]|nr:hypothetical protein [Paludibacteraceae bacterium]